MSGMTSSEPEYRVIDGERRRRMRCRRCERMHYGPVFEVAGREFQLDFLCPECDEAMEAVEAQKAAEKRANGKRFVSDAEAREIQWKTQVCPAKRFQDVLKIKLPGAAQENWEAVMSWDPAECDMGLVLVGLSQRGKSMLIHGLAHRLHLDGHGVLIVYLSEFGRVCGSHQTAKRDALLDQCERCPVLVLDDLDKAKLTDRVEADLFHVIDMRERYERPILCTLNADPRQLEAMMGENRGMPLINRLKRSCQFVKIG